MKLEITIERQDTFETLEEIKALPDGARIYHEDGYWAEKTSHGILFEEDDEDDLIRWDEMGDNYATMFSFRYRIELTDGNAELVLDLLKANHLDKWH